MNNPFETIEQRLTSIESKLTIMERHVQEQPSESGDRWLDIDDIVEYDPAKRTKPTWYGLVARREVPYHKQGKKLYFLKSEIDEWLRSGRRKTLKETEAEAHTSLKAPRR